MVGVSGGTGICSLLTTSSFVFGDGKVVLNLVLILLLNICSSISVSFKGVKNCLNQNLYEAKIFVFRKWKLSFFLSLFFKIKVRYINLVST